MNVIVGCEYSNRVRDAFIAAGHFAVSADLLACDGDTHRIIEDVNGVSRKVAIHYQGDIFDYLAQCEKQNVFFNLLIAHPPCTFLTLAGARWFYDPKDKSKPHPKYPNRWKDRDEGVEFFQKLQNYPIDKSCLENSQPLRYVTDRVGEYTQKVQPWMFGEPYTKGACLWLKNLPPLVATHTKPEIIHAACHLESPGPDRWKRRSTTYQCIANAMAAQWGSL